MNRNIDKKLDDHIQLIERYARVALLKIKKPAKYSLDDLIQEGVLAFLLAEKEFVEGRGATFRTYLTRCLRNWFASLVKHTYQNKEKDGFQEKDYNDEWCSKKKTIPDILELVQVSFIIKSLSKEELQYISTVLSFSHIHRRSRRKNSRTHLGISYEREVELRNSIKDKIKK